MAATEVGCEHYVRSCLLKAPCCGKFYVCRLCHDAEENHQMDRFKAQQTCKECEVKFGEYYCDICHLFDKDKKQYHCQPCGICRIGPREKYFHCTKCNLCLATDLKDNHKAELPCMYGGHPHVQNRGSCAPLRSSATQIMCNDCQAHCTVSFHVLGMKCSSCGSYNTAQDGGLIAAPAINARQSAEQPLEEEPDTEHHE
ncbi:RING finger and CHY zinc finger domain-containing protein 1 [Labeo rohita]|uniref:RING finger and CHY zinc finger domain-containing protein 1 n=1 Tax=Labeo rohita TaxID=84645 RepID=A0ABQ8MRH2_LABRO|nr:RING finger and CHY zinc finger domain-containing protein 1 [Labeo rohita]